jgi:predicted CXXCH cytochrome family protein
VFPMACVLAVLLTVVVFVLWTRRIIGIRRAGVLELSGLLGISAVWAMQAWTWRSEPPQAGDVAQPGKSSRLASTEPSRDSSLADDPTNQPPVTSEACVKCHESQFASWKQTYHRTMTREPTPENIKGNFNDAVMTYNGIESRMTQVDGRFLIDTIDPVWEEQVLEVGLPLEKAGPMKRTSISVDRVVGSHWMQQYFHRGKAGRYYRLPLAYHIVEKRWIHINGAFLQPSSPKFWANISVWNGSCLYCHNTRPIGNPYPLPNDPVPGYHSAVGELGIACEACHGASDRHVRAHLNMSRKPDQIAGVNGDPTVVNPARLPVPRSDDVCARCHSQPIARNSKWNHETLADPFLAGAELNRTWKVSFSEHELDEHARDEHINRGIRKGTGEIDGKFWGDGTPLTTALEFQGMSLSKCYQNGQGEMRCLTCHSMHKSDPNHLLKEGMRTNEACYGCHETYRTRLVEHTHHAADSAGSQCMNCHMPRHVYSLLDTHRSHRITIPTVRNSVDTGKPHACNLCHLDKSLGWTSDRLQAWYGTKPEPLSEDDRKFASSLLHLSRGDARSRAIVAGAFSSPDAHKASGRDWPGRLLTRALQHERYEAIRYLLHRSLRSLYGPSARDYNFEGTPSERAAQLSALEKVLDDETRVDARNYPNLPLTEHGRFDDLIDRWMQNRSDPDIYIKE